MTPSIHLKLIRNSATFQQDSIQPTRTATATSTRSNPPGVHSIKRMKYCLRWICQVICTILTNKSATTLLRAISI